MQREHRPCREQQLQPTQTALKDVHFRSVHMDKDEVCTTGLQGHMALLEWRSGWECEWLKLDFCFVCLFLSYQQKEKERVRAQTCWRDLN